MPKKLLIGRIVAIFALINQTMKMKPLKFAFLLLLIVPLLGRGQDAKIKWISIDEALAASQEAPKKILIDIYTDWCSWCKVMDNRTFSDTSVIKYISDNYYAVKLNAERQADFAYKGNTFKLISKNGRSINEWVMAVSNGNISYPTIAYLDENQDVLTLVPGFQKPEQLLPILQYLGEDKYKTTTFEDFMKQKKSL